MNLFIGFIIENVVLLSPRVVMWSERNACFYLPVRSVRRMRRTIIFRDNMINMLAESDCFVATTSVAASTTSTTAIITGGTMSYAIRFLLSLAMKSLQKRIQFMEENKIVISNVEKQSLK